MVINPYQAWADPFPIIGSYDPDKRRSKALHRRPGSAMLCAWGWIMSNWLIRIINSVIAFGIPFALCAAFLIFILMVRTRRRRRRIGKGGEAGVENPVADATFWIGVVLAYTAALALSAWAALVLHVDPMSYWLIAIFGPPALFGLVAGAFWLISGFLPPG
jgi:hypothetical protein